MTIGMSGLIELMGVADDLKIVMDNDDNGGLS